MPPQHPPPRVHTAGAPAPFIDNLDIPREPLWFTPEFIERNLNTGAAKAIVGLGPSILFSGKEKQEAKEGPPISAVLKPDISEPMTSLIEWICGSIGRAIGAPIAEPVGALITDEFAALDPRLKPCEVCGSRFQTGILPLLQEPLLPKPMRESAWKLIAFDAYVQNLDRLLKNPNMGRAANQIFAYDHDKALSFVRDIAYDRETASNALWLDESRVHPLARHVRRSTMCDKIPQTFSILDEKWFSRLLEVTPIPWKDGLDNEIERIVDTLTDRARNLKWLTNLSKCL